MSWYKGLGASDGGALGRSWKYRASISVYYSGVTGTKDVTITVPVDWDFFWENVTATGNDIRVTSGNGYTLLTYQVLSFDQTTRTATIQIQAASLDGSTLNCFWLYWGHSSASSGATTFTASSPVTGYIELGKPQILIPVQREGFGDSRPRNTLSKQASETLWVWFDLAGLLHQRGSPFQDRALWEEIQYATVKVYNAGVDDTAMYEPTSMRIVQGRYLKAEIKAGSSGDDRTVRLTIGTKNPLDVGQVLQASIWLKVRTVSEA